MATTTDHEGNTFIDEKHGHTMITPDGTVLFDVPTRHFAADPRTNGMSLLVHTDREAFLTFAAHVAAVARYLELCDCGASLADPPEEHGIGCPVHDEWAADAPLEGCDPYS